MNRHRALVMLLPVLPLLVACGYDNGRDDGGPSPSNETAAEAPIDLDGTIDPGEPGTGIGVFVEYGPAGHWRVFTSCDTAKSGATCAWDVALRVADGSKVETFKVESFEADDQFTWYGPRDGSFLPTTGTDLDGLQFDVTPPSPLLIDAYLDGGDARQYIYWLSGGAVNFGAATNPIRLVPGAAVAAQ